MMTLVQQFDHVIPVILAAETSTCSEVLEIEERVDIAAYERDIEGKKRRWHVCSRRGGVVGSDGRGVGTSAVLAVDAVALLTLAASATLAAFLALLAFDRGMVVGWDRAWMTV
jgi:hypothetical protein